MTAKELIDEFVQERISSGELLDKVPSVIMLLDLMRQEVKEAEHEQARHMELLMKIQRDPRTVMRIEYIQAIKQIVNGN